MARKCRECGRPMRATRQDYRYVESGLQHVLLKNIVVYECDCGGQIAEIPNMGPLHRAIMMDLLTKKTLLCGEEIRFLRKMARLKAKELAELLGAQHFPIQE